MLTLNDEMGAILIYRSPFLLGSRSFLLTIYKGYAIIDTERTIRACGLRRKSLFSHYTAEGFSVMPFAEYLFDVTVIHLYC